MVKQLKSILWFTSWNEMVAKTNLPEIRKVRLTQKDGDRYGSEINEVVAKRM